MAWQGIPFRVPLETNEFLTLALNSIPKMTMKLETDPDYKGLMLTAGAALVGGIIPAIIAGLTFWINSRNVKRERKEQERFLSNERGAQQQFLKDERIAQGESLDADREAQLAIATKNFNMQVLSANRQAWINDVRSTVSEFLSLLDVCLMANFDARFKGGEFERYSNLLKNTSLTGEYAEQYKYILERSNQINEAIEQNHAKLDEVRSRIKFLENKIKLLLNPHERLSKLIIRRIELLRGLVWHLKKADVDLSRQLRSDVESIEIKLVRNLQKCLKKEWERVKDGV